MALSRSTAQYSQPTLERWASARLHRSTQSPETHAMPLAASHVCTGAVVVPVTSHARTVAPSQLRAAGRHAVQAVSDGAHTFFAAPQSSRCVVVSPSRLHCTSAGPWQNETPGVHVVVIASGVSR